MRPKRDIAFRLLLEAMSKMRSGQWSQLFDLSLDIIEQAKNATYEFDWTFGGGTALMLQIDHRESHDVDLFLDDVQLLPFLNPETQNYNLSVQPDGYEGDGTHVVKLIFDEVGEIDFICCGPVTDNPARVKSIYGHNVRLETPAEIVAKKIYHRGSRIQPRDMFDIAAAIQYCGEDYIVDALRACGQDRCAEALAVVEAMNQTLASDVMGQLMFREHNGCLPSKAQSATQAVLRTSLGL